LNLIIKVESIELRIKKEVSNGFPNPGEPRRGRSPLPKEFG